MAPSDDAGDYMAMTFEVEPERPRTEPMSIRGRLDQGLATPIPASNRGHQLLLRMGYTPGQGLGKTGSGVQEPIAIDTSPGSRSGLGLKRHAAQVAEIRLRLAHRMKQAQDDAFRGAMSHQYAVRRVEGKLATAQRVCRQLDEEAGLFVNFMWLADQRPSSADAFYDPERDAFGYESVQHEPIALRRRVIPPAERLTEVEDKLDEILSYLRVVYSYCLYCGYKYRDNDDLLAHCPGLFEEDH
ncbi:G-patch domain-containing protein [Plasmodiophora brassicae]|uniref:G-patch domain-containing protein n=1 Tax=Plasmodiophora brassicae TaxID=37360 RepID=A0A0G4IK76_PLABS|nr:hypothetical protein PBRA_004265 [Plasmodiophora brassicae]